MSDVKLGELITGDAQRDAIHVAVVPLVAGERLYPGDEFRLKYGTTDVALRALEVCYGNDMLGIGIVDPFLDVHELEEGQMFWGLLKQNTVTGMRHHWQHPSFDNLPSPPEISESERWLRNFCDKYNMRFDDVVREAQENGGYATARGVDLHGREELADGEHALFWHNMSMHTGKVFDANHKENFEWSCSC